MKWSVPFGLCINLIIGSPYGLIAGVTFCLGGLWLSPDLDTCSEALKKWGFLKLIWFPYRKLIPHRSLFSHGPLIGTTIRIIYLNICLALLVAIATYLRIIPEIQLHIYLLESINNNPKLFITILLSLEASAWLHLIKDGDPLPNEFLSWWHKYK